ncbi:MAG: diaminopimelate decarboxylase [Dehalococcoidia bacterium]
MSQGRLAVFPRTTEIDSSNHIAIGGCDLVALAEEYGTPLYLFDEETLRYKCREFRREFSQCYPDTQVVYACKAYVSPSLARIFREEGLGLDVVSGGELAVAQSVGYPPEMVYFHGNNKGPDELEAALEWGLGRVVVDNFHELGLLNGLARKKGRTQEILIRISPGVDPHTHSHTTTGILDSKFGVPIEGGQAEGLVKEALAASNLDLIGLHFHLGSPIYEVEPYRQAVEIAMSFADQMRQRHGFALREFSPGGGFAIQYTEDEPPPAVAEYASVIASAVLENCKGPEMPPPRLVIEPGRAIVGQAGVAVYRVGSTKDVPGIRKYISVDGGMGDNIRPAIYGSRYEAMVANKASSPPQERVTIAGKFCESGDILVKDIDLPRVEAGDLIAIPASGAYCLSMASNYNAAPRPPIVLVKEGKPRLIRRRETYQDLMQWDL